jgi:hypothetical protein
LKKNKINIDSILDKDFDEEIYEKLMSDFIHIEMSQELEDRIINSTILKTPSLLDKIKDVLNKEIEIPVPIVAFSALALIILLVNPFVVTENMKKNSSMLIASKANVISLNGIGYVFIDESFTGGALHEGKN